MTLLKGITLETIHGDEYFIDSDNLEFVNMFGIGEGAYLENKSLVKFKTAESLYVTIKDVNEIHSGLLTEKGLRTVYFHYDSGGVSSYELRWENMIDSEYVNPCQTIVTNVTGRVHIVVKSLEEK